jgi:LysR family transcriptional regulator, carnitine catabolism transcriptional activator
MASLATLKTFVTVVEAGGIQKAAERLGRTPSAVSMALKQFEQEIGARLFVGDRKDRLTEVGLFSEVQAREVLSHYERALLSAQAYARTAIGRIDVACVPSVATTIMPTVVRRIREIAPGSEINLRDIDSISVIRTVEQGEYGIGIATPIHSRDNLSFSPLFSEPLGIVCRRDDPLAKTERPITWDALKGRLVLENGLSFLVKGAAYKALLEQSSIKVYSHTAVLAMVRAGIAITVLSRLSVAPDGDLSFLPIADRSAVRSVGLFLRSTESLSPAEVRFIAVMREVLAREHRRLGLIIASAATPERREPRPRSKQPR